LELKSDDISSSTPWRERSSARQALEDARMAFARSGYELANQPGQIIRRAHQRNSTFFQQIMAEDRLSPTQFAALATILKHGAISQNHLGRLTSMDPSTISIVIRKLHKDGLVRRARSQTDQRLSILTLTDEGAAYTLARIERSLEVGERLLSTLSQDEQATLLDLLRRVADDVPPQPEGSPADL
jgi:DNA-binding MarR family transcriptional regulator